MVCVFEQKGGRGGDGRETRERDLTHKATNEQLKDKGGDESRTNKGNGPLGRKQDFYSWSYAAGEGYI
jgi:hypothetical protein